MQNEKIRSVARELLQPVFDELTDISAQIYISMLGSLPSDLPEEQKLDLIKKVLENQATILKTSIKGIVPTDFEAKLKEAMNGK